MDNMVNGDSQVQNTSSATEAVNTSASVGTSPAQTASDEKLFKQQEVNDIVGRAKHEAVERYKRSADQQYTQTQPLHQQQLESLNSDSIRRIAAEEIQRSRDTWIQDAQRTAQEQEAKRIADEFLGKLDAGKGKYEDYDSVIGSIDFSEIPYVAQMANYMDNTADIVYELAKNPGRIGSLLATLRESPRLALAQMQQLSRSIKDNESAAKVRMPNEPLSQLKPSTSGADDGKLSVRDYRAKYRG